MKRRIISALLAVMLLVGLASCGGRKKYTTDKLVVWVWDQSQVEKLEELASAWAQRSKLEVEITAKTPDAYWKDVSTGLLPDLMWVDDEHLPALAQSGALLALDEQIANSKKLDVERFSETVRSSLLYNGAAYAVPVRGETWALWYNRALFDSVGRSYPDETWTWEDVRDAAKALTDRNNGCYGIVLPCRELSAWYQVIYAYGGAVVGTDDKTGEAVSYWQSEPTMAAMRQIGWMILESMPSQPAMDQLGSAALFANGDAGMVLLNRSQGAAMLGGVTTNQWKCTMLPYEDLDGSGDCTEGERVCLTGGVGWAISNRSTDAKAAFELLEVLGGKDARAVLYPEPVSEPVTEATEDATGESSTAAAAVVENPLAAYDRMEREAVLLERPRQSSGESWEDYAVNTTMYTAWNNPAQMESMLKQQNQYTQNQLDKRSAAEETTEKS